MTHTRTETAQAIAQLIPSIVQGAHIGSMTKGSITQTQFLVLVFIYARKNTPMSQIAKKMNVRLPTVTGMIDRLVLSGYVKRVVNPDDRRQVMVTLTPQGLRLLQQFQLIIGERWENVLRVLSQKELEQFYKIVIKLTEYVQVREL